MLNFLKFAAVFAFYAFVAMCVMGNIYAGIAKWVGHESTLLAVLFVGLSIGFGAVRATEKVLCKIEE